jgi:hypothetical protein
MYIKGFLFVYCDEDSDCVVTYVMQSTITLILRVGERILGFIQSTQTNSKSLPSIMPRPVATSNILSNWYFTVFSNDAVYTEQMQASLNKRGATKNVKWNTPLI